MRREGGRGSTVKADGTVVIRIDLVHDVLKLGFGGFEPKGSHHVAQLCGCDLACVSLECYYSYDGNSQWLSAIRCGRYRAACVEKAR